MKLMFTISKNIKPKISPYNNKQRFYTFETLFRTFHIYKKMNILKAFMLTGMRDSLLTYEYLFICELTLLIAMSELGFADRAAVAFT